MANDTSALVDAARTLSAARAVAVISGAGMSAESGVPTFRGPGGLWRTFRPEDVATPEAFARTPTLVWEWYWWRRRRIAEARPNLGHLALARLETRFPHFTLFTQNVDGLHAEAGSRAVVELHGNIWRARCAREPAHVENQRASPIPDVDPERPAGRVSLPMCALCGAPLRPDVVWFGEALEPLALDRAAAAVRACDVLLLVGTSAVVYPVAALPSLARQGQAVVIEVNVDETAFTSQADIVLRGPSGRVLPELERRL
jgi:NAD-dependent deacetylase